MYKDRKETTHVEIGERKHTPAYKEDKHNVCKHGHKTQGTRTRR